ncbi:hypothetical protein DXG01_004138, partial [Tephrocybe rancida]
QVMSKEKNLVLAGALPTMERFLEGWEHLAEAEPRLRPLIKRGLHCAQTYYSRMDDTDAYIITLCTLPLPYENWEKSWIEQAERIIKNKMELYRVRHAINGQPSALSLKKAKQSSDGWLNLRLPHHLGLPSHMTMDTDLGWNDNSFQVLLVDDEFHHYTFGTRSKFDVNIFKFWGVIFDAEGTLYIMALDYLPIQASSVPCKRAFSSSAETDTSCRNRISPILMETLQMLKFSIRHKEIDFTSHLMKQDCAMEMLHKISHKAIEDLLALLGRTSKEKA